MTLANLTITGAQTGVYLDDNSGSTGITVKSSTITANDEDLYVGADDNSFTLTNSTVSHALSGYSLEISGAENALVANDTISLTPNNYDPGGLMLQTTTNAVISDDVLIGNGSSAYLLYASSSTNLLVDGVTASGSGYAAIEVQDSTGTVENSTISSSLVDQALGIGGPTSGVGTMTAKDNTVYAVSIGEGSAVITVDDDAVATGNTVYGGDIGILLSDSGVDALQPPTAYGNHVYKTGTGILLYDDSIAQGNTVNDNTIGVVLEGRTGDAVENNTLYDNATGIQIASNPYGEGAGNTVVNNTIVQTTGAALSLLPGSDDTTFIDNIVSLTGATGIVAPDTAQVGFASDYNLFYLQAGATVATWSGQTIATLNEWKTEVGLDANSLAANPDFVNAADDDYLLTNASPALNRGDPSLSYINKPISATTGNGDRIDIGAQGNTDQANPSPSQLIQLLGATGGQRYQVGQAATISFRSAGLAALDPVIFINAGGGKAQGAGELERVAGQRIRRRSGLGQFRFRVGERRRLGCAASRPAEHVHLLFLGGGRQLADHDLSGPRLCGRVSSLPDLRRQFVDRHWTARV